MTATNPAEMLDAHVGQRIPGGCDHCAAVQTVHAEDTGIYRLQIAHDDGCPTLHHHTTVVPLRVRLDELRRQWCWWRDIDIERLAGRDDIDLAGELIPEAGGDRVLAARAWRAGCMAQLELLGQALAEQLAEAEGRAAT